MPVLAVFDGLSNLLSPPDTLTRFIGGSLNDAGVPVEQSPPQHTRAASLTHHFGFNPHQMISSFQLGCTDYYHFFILVSVLL